jgi:hypothetical protein
MKNLLLALLFVTPASAGVADLPAAAGAARGLARGTAAALATRTSLIRVDACYERAADAEADRLGLPARLCLETVSLTSPDLARDPFNPEAYMSVTGTPPAPRMHIGGGARESDGWEVVGSWLSTRAGKKPKCGALNSAHASIYVKTAYDGTLKDAPVTVRAFLMDGSALCPNYARAVHFDYKKI